MMNLKQKLMMQDTNDEPKIETNDELKIETNDELKIETDNDCVLHQKSRVFSKVMTFAWLVAHMNVNTNGMLQLRRPFKVLSPNWCIICRRNREMIDDLPTLSDYFGIMAQDILTGWDGVGSSRQYS